MRWARSSTDTCGAHGFSVIRDLTGHGVGRTIHEPPEVPNYDPGGRSPLLTDGLVIAIEPLVAERSGAVRVAGDKWTIATRDGGWTAHWEHTIVVTARGGARPHRARARRRDDALT